MTAFLQQRVYREQHACGHDVDHENVSEDGLHFWPLSGGFRLRGLRLEKPVSFKHLGGAAPQGTVLVSGGCEAAMGVGIERLVEFLESRLVGLLRLARLARALFHNALHGESPLV